MVDRRSVNPLNQSRRRNGITLPSELPELPIVRNRLVTNAMLIWVIFVYIVYYWNLIQYYGSEVLKRVCSLIP